jgi:3-deoxy-D-manno-octulosonic acid kinase
LSRNQLFTTGNVTVVYDPAEYPAFEPGWFDQAEWHGERAHVHTKTGRGGVLMLDVGGETWVRRHYHRGGLVSRLVYDHYVWSSAEAARPIREWRLLKHMKSLGLPVPVPVAGRAVRIGLLYQADLITVLLPDTRPLSSAIAVLQVDSSLWPSIGAMLRRFHAAGVDHPDLTAHNILLDSQGQTFLLDFDNARIRPRGSWEKRRMARLRRSLRKVALETGTQFDERGWKELISGYMSA